MRVVKSAFQADYITCAAVITRRKIELVAFERERVVRRPASVRCPVCRLDSELLTTRQAGAHAQVGAASVRQWLARGKIHVVKTPGGQYRVCRDSLFRIMCASPASG